MTTRDEQAAALFRALADLYSTPAIAPAIARLTPAATVPRLGPTGLNTHMTMPGGQSASDNALTIASMNALMLNSTDASITGPARAQGVEIVDYALLIWSEDPAVEAASPQTCFRASLPATCFTANMVTVGSWGQRIPLDLSNAVAVAARVAQLVKWAVAQKLDRVFLDEMGGEPQLLVGTAPQFPDWATVSNLVTNIVAKLSVALAAKGIGLSLNTSESVNADQLAWMTAANTPGLPAVAHMENLTNPARAMAARWALVDAMLATGAIAQTVPALAERDYASIVAMYPPGNSASSADRGRLFELASHYMTLSSAARCRFAPINSGKDQQPFATVWRPMHEYDLGAPSGPRTKMWSGTDGAGQPAEVWQRQYANAFLIARPSHTDTQSDATFDDLTLVSWPQMGYYAASGAQVLGAQGLAALPSGLRNGEAVIVVQ